MSAENLDRVMDWAFFVFIAIFLTLLIKAIALLVMGKIKMALIYFGSDILWIIYTLILVSIAFLAGMDHASATNAGNVVVVLSLLHTITAAGIIFFLLRKKFVNPSN